MSELWERALAARRKESAWEVPFVKKTLKILAKSGVLAYAEWNQWQGVTLAALRPDKPRKVFTVVPKSDDWAESLRGNPMTPSDVAHILTRDR